MSPICTWRCFRQQQTHQDYHRKLKSSAIIWPHGPELYYSLFFPWSQTKNCNVNSILVSFLQDPACRCSSYWWQDTLAHVSMILGNRVMGKQQWTEWFVLLHLSSPFLSEKGFSGRVCLDQFYLCKSLIYPREGQLDCISRRQSLLCFRKIFLDT